MINETLLKWLVIIYQIRIGQPKCILIGIFLLSFVGGCTHKKDSGAFIRAKYEGYWAETMWTYEFKQNGQFIFVTSGHYGNVIDSGFYLIKDSLILLNPRSDRRVADGVLMTRLKIINPECLRDYENNFYCTSLDNINELTDREFAFQENVKNILDTLQKIRIQKARIASKYPEPNLAIVYSGIVLIDNREFHDFRLINYDIDTGMRTYLSFLATREPFDIFEYDHMNDKMTSVLIRN